jgi:glutamate carboxypeptidase
MPIRAYKLITAVLVATATCGPTMADPQPIGRLLEAVKSCDANSRRLIERLVATDSGTGDAEGLAAVAGIYELELRELGAQVRKVPPALPAVGDNVVATWKGTGKGRVLLIAHMDTVFGRGDAAKLGPHWEGDHYVGPGAGDDKSGGVTALCAVRALNSVGYKDFGRIDLLLNASEETGSLGSRDLIRGMAKASDLAINLERGVPSDRAVVARKGSAVLTIEVTGRAAHSGLEPEKGRNAVLEAARVALALDKLGDPAQQTTVVVDMLNGGERTNVVPDHAVIKVDVRAFTTAEFDRVEQASQELAEHPQIQGVTVKSSMQRNFPPWAHQVHADRIITRANHLYAELDRRLTAWEVGSSADVAFAAETGTPAIDGFGMEGGGAHTSQDYADFSTLVPRSYLLARMLMDVGHDPRGL